MSSDDVAIRVQGVGKCYEIYHRQKDRLKQIIVPSVQKVFGQTPKTYYEPFWALKDINFEVMRGQSVGIIGQNGSGKSTLLQLITGILKPTTGAVDVKGRIAALIELGSGFNLQFTGRENIILNATLLGVSKEEILSKFDEIEKFADIGQFIDQPVRIYSSGMFARLAFAVSINVSPDILIIDEALAVGDEMFQRKCFAKIEEIKSKGTTILFVSHSGTAIINLCDSAILLQKGNLIFQGKPKLGVYYLQKIGNATPSEVNNIIKEIQETQDISTQELRDELNHPIPSKTIDEDSTYKAFYDPSLIIKDILAYKPKDAAIISAQLITEEEENVNHILNGKYYQFRVKLEFFNDCEGVRGYALIRTTNGIDLAGCAYPNLHGTGFSAKKGDKVVIDFKFKCMLNQGAYFCNFALQDKDGSLLHRMVDALAFKVMPTSSLKQVTGLVDLEYKPLFYSE